MDRQAGSSEAVGGDGASPPSTRWAVAAALCAVLLAACGASDPDDSAVSSDPAEPTPASVPDAQSPASDGAATLTVESTWQWQLQGTVDTTFDVDVYDIDLFESPPELIEDLHADNRVVICYFSAGSYEGWRPDADGFAADTLGDTLDGFEDEQWLDIREPTVRTAIEGRLDQADELGCDGVEPDNVDGYLNETGFDLTGADQLEFHRFIADAAHDRGLLVGLKNDLDQISDLVTSFDFAVNEQCHEFDECELNQPFVDAGKPVFNAEYASEFVDDANLVCPDSLALGLRTLILPLDLDGSFRITCDT